MYRTELKENRVFAIQTGCVPVCMFVDGIDAGVIPEIETSDHRNP